MSKEDRTLNGNCDECGKPFGIYWENGYEYERVVGSVKKVGNSKFHIICEECKDHLKNKEKCNG